MKINELFKVIKGKRMTKTYNFPNLEDMDLFQKFAYLIETREDFLTDKGDSWVIGKIQSESFRSHSKNFVKNNDKRLVGEEYEEHKKKFYADLIKRGIIEVI